MNEDFSEPEPCRIQRTFTVSVPENVDQVEVTAWAYPGIGTYTETWTVVSARSGGPSSPSIEVSHGTAQSGGGTSESGAAGPGALPGSTVARTVEALGLSAGPSGCDPTETPTWEELDTDDPAMVEDGGCYPTKPPAWTYPARPEPHAAVVDLVVRIVDFDN